VGKDLLQLSLKNIYLKKPARLKNDFWQLAATSFAKSKENISPPHPKNGQPPNQPNNTTFRPLFALFSGKEHAFALLSCCGDCNLRDSGINYLVAHFPLFFYQLRVLVRAPRPPGHALVPATTTVRNIGLHNNVIKLNICFGVYDFII